MKEPKRYYCGNGEGMFEDDKNGHWVEYTEHKAIVEALTEQLRKHAVSGRSELLVCECERNNPYTGVKFDFTLRCFDCNKIIEQNNCH